MKTVLKSIFFIPLAAGLLFTATSCSDDDPAPAKEEMVAKAFVYSGHNGQGSDSCILYVVAKGKISDAQIISSMEEGGYYLRATLSTTADSKASIPAGTYNVAESGNNVPFTYVPGAGSLANDNLTGNYYCSVKNETNDVTLVNQGPIVIGQTGTNYTISYTYVENGKQIQVNYQGPIQFVQLRKQVAKAFVYAGNGRGSDSCDLYIVGGGEISDEGVVTGLEKEGDYYVAVSLNINSGSENTIPAGTYKVSDFGNYKPFTFNPGMGDHAQNNLRGTYYGIMDYLLMLRITHFVQGSITISQNGDMYKLSTTQKIDGSLKRIDYQGPIVFIKK